MAKEQLKAYQTAQLKNMTPREVEAMAFTKAANMMDDAKRNPGDFAVLSQAVRFNHLFWTILQADITDPANKLPGEIKANIMSLSLFVDRQTTQALRSRDTDDLDILITINRNLAMGLRENPAAPVPDSTATPSATTA